MTDLRDFVEKRHGRYELEKAVRQQEQIKYLTVSSVQDDLRGDYFNKYAEAKNSINDPMLQWVYMLFKKDNFESFYKYLRFPVASSSVCKDEIEKSLERVFFADDSFTKYKVNNKQVEAPDFLNKEAFDKEIFKAVLYRYNDIVIHDLTDVNKPFRKLLKINDVTSIKVRDNKIVKIAYKSEFNYDGKDVKGNTYLDSSVFAFIPDERGVPTIEIPHDIEICPACFIVESAFDDDEPIVREGVYSRVRPLLEQYVFLTTLQLMSDSNGAFPVIVKLATDSLNSEGNDQPDNLHPMSAQYLDGYTPSKTVMGVQAGDVTELDAVIKADGSIDTGFIDNYIKFFRTPVESLNYIKGRIHDVRKQIIETVVGDYVEQSEESKNELQVSKSYLIKQDKLRGLATDMGYCLNISDEIMLKLANGKNCSVNRSMGTDFFIETIQDLFTQVTTAPNPIEKANVMYRITRIRGANNDERSKRDNILYKLIPYTTNEDFTTALGLQIPTIEEILLQTKFHYFISVFEATYGDIVSFWYEIESKTDNEKLIFVKNLINQIIKDYEKTEQKETGSVEGDQIPIRA